MAPRMRKVIRKAINSLGLDVHWTEAGKPRWSSAVEDYYPLNPRPRWGHGRPSHPEISRILQARKGDFSTLLKEFQQMKAELAAIPNDPVSLMGPCWNNIWFSTLDAASLICLLALRAPGRYVEIGSGTSTKFARHTIGSKKLATRLTSIDPQPRAEIDRLCDEVVRQPLEDLDPAFFDSLSDGDFLFFDGSHRTFTNSDVTAFFFDVLPRLKSGVVVHIHDIFWPDDYPPEWNGRLYSEQYLLGALWMGCGARYRILLPNYFVSCDPETVPLVRALDIPLTYPRRTMPGVSVWLEIA